LSPNAGGLNPAKAVGDQDQNEQGDRKADAKRQGLHGAVGFSVVPHEEYQRGTEAEKNQDEGNGNDSFHDAECSALQLPDDPQQSGESDIVMPIKFRFRWIPFIAALIAVAIGVSLGQWQTRRAAEKEQIERKLSERQAARALAIGAEPQTVDDVEFRRVVVKGEFVREWPVYLDNRPYQGAAGFYVLMPLKIAGSNHHVMVSRGWVRRDIADRTRLPQLKTPEGVVELEGVAKRSPGHVLQLGTPEPLRPNAIVQNVDIAAFAQASKMAMQPFVIEQLTDMQDSLVRDWPRPSAGVDKHRGYAFQWYALAATAFIFFIVTGFRSGRK
jgi:cytochrome oxidase assembly protein ShyY1